MWTDQVWAGKELELTFIKKYLLCARHLLVCLHTSHIQAHEGRNCCDRISDGETEVHRD